MQTRGRFFRTLTILLGIVISTTSRAVDVELPMVTPRLESLSAEIPLAEGGAVAIDFQLGFDAKGKLICGGVCTVDGADVAVKGSIKTRKGISSYTLSARGVSEKVRAKIKGTLSGGATGAAVRYSGPKGKASAVIDVTVTAPAALGLFSFEPSVDAKGKISGSGRIVGNFGNDVDELGDLKGKLKNDKLSLALKVGTRKISFKGTRDGDQFVGTLKLKVPPEKTTRSQFPIPDFTLPVDGGVSNDFAVLPPMSPTREPDVLIEGTATTGRTIRIVGGAAIAEVVADSSGEFAVPVTLKQNRVNRLFVTETDPDGDSGTSTPFAVDVIHDEQAPTLFIDEPADGDILTDESVIVAGRVGDLLSGFMDLDVTVNGEPANVIVGIGTNGTFERGPVALDLGFNTITVVATDVLGNSTTRSATVERVKIPDDAIRMIAVSGNAQRGRVGERLADPIVVRVENPDGTPFARKLVDLVVVRSNGRLATSPVAGGTDLVTGLRQRTDENGEVTAYWWLGSDAGCGNNRVAVSSRDVAGSTTLCASAEPRTPEQINVGSGDGQTLEAGGRAPELLRAWVSDSCNGVAGIPVTFTVTRGDGAIDGSESVTVETSITGHAEVPFTLGTAAGNNAVEADFPGNPGAPATFVCRGIARTEGEATRFRGVVLDNAGQPLEGALCRLSFPGTSSLETTSNRDGVFSFDDIVDSGAADLHVNGLEVTHAGGVEGEDVPRGSYPALAYQVVVVPNAENSLSTPVLLPSLDPANARFWDGDQDIELTVEGIDGLRMTVRADSMTLADGSRPSDSNPVTLALNQVHQDDIPMQMPDGASPPFAWTLQPSGAHFDPPVQIRYPNMAGLPAGSIAYFLSFDHDTHRFEIVATGQVRADGAFIDSDPGTGITVAGWGGNCPPYTVTGDVAYCEADGGGASGETDGGGANDIDCEGCNLTIDAPERICGSGPGATNSITIRADSEISGGSFQWETIQGGDKAGIAGPTNESSASLVAIDMGEAVVRVTYTVNGVSCSADKTITVDASTGRFVGPGGGGNNALLALNISNFVTTAALDDNDGDKDPDNFKLEIEDGSVAEAVDEITSELESLTPSGAAFSPPRKLDVTLKRVPATNTFRSGWLRLVTWEVDRDAASAKALLVSTDSSRPELEILGQVVRANYKDCSFEIRVGEDPLKLNLAVHVLNGIVPRTFVTVPTIATVRNRIENSVRQVYAQANIQLGNVTYESVDLPENMLTISQQTGRPASGGVFDLRIESTIGPGDGGVVTTWELLHNTLAGQTPFETALSLAVALEELAPVSGTGTLSATAFENQQIYGSPNRSADVLINAGNGAAVRIVTATSTDPSHCLDVPKDVGEGDLALEGDGQGGSPEQRALARNYGSTGSTIDVWVIGRIVERARDDSCGVTGLTLAQAGGRAFTHRALRTEAERQPEPLRHSVFATAASANGSTVSNAFTLAHEIGHVLLDASHVVADVTGAGDPPAEERERQLMVDGTGSTTTVAASRRIQDGLVLFDRVGGVSGLPPSERQVNQVQVMRSSPLLNSGTGNGNQ